MRTLFAFFFLISSPLFSQTKIQLNPDMVVNITGWGDADMLADEQAEAGDPASGAGGSPATVWLPGWTDWYYPCTAVIDLKAEYVISDVWFYDAHGTGSVSFYTGSPGAWDLLATDQMNTYLTWRDLAVNQTCRYLRVTIEVPAAAPVEIVVYGTKTGEEEPVPEPVEHARPLIRDFAGLNGFIDDATELLQVCNFVREYHNWSWNESYQDLLKFAPSYPGWNFDNYYRTLRDSGITVAPCLKQSVAWLTSDIAFKPVAAGLDPEDPYSYMEKASYMFQYAARYGSQHVDQSLLRLDPSQDPLSGMGYLKYYEDWNEQDAWWEGREGYFTPYEYAAMSSANYDGHLGALGVRYGIKTADPEAKLVMGGLAKLNLDYLKSMKYWADANRNGSFPADVINLHHYSNDNGGQGSSTTGISPEADGMKERFEEFVDYRNRYLPGKEVWVTEFGYDVHPESVQRAPAIGTFTGEEVQAMWLIRSYLALAAAGVDRAAMYMSRDADVVSSTKYATSGLSEGGTKRKRESWYYLKTFVNLLGDTRFDQEIPTDGGEVLNYKFLDPETGSSVYVLWSPTSDQTTLSGYSFTLPEGSANHTIVEFRNLDVDGDTLVAYSFDETVTLTVTEKPVFVIVDGAITNTYKPKAGQRLKVFPAIADEYLEIENPGEREVEVRLTDINGRSIRSFRILGGITRVDVASLTPGAYLLFAEEFSPEKIIIY